jgi:hypothetical protein
VGIYGESVQEYCAGSVVPLVVAITATVRGVPAVRVNELLESRPGVVTLPSSPMRRMRKV